MQDFQQLQQAKARCIANSAKQAQKVSGKNLTVIVRPGETIIDDTHIALEDLGSTCEGYINNSNEPKVIVIKAD